MSLSDGSGDDLSSISSPEMNETNPRDAFLRSGHVAVGFENELLIWGGSRCSPLHDNDYCDPNVLWVYNTLNDVYTRREILGLPPQGSCGSAAVIHDGSLYIFGGFARTSYPSNSPYSNFLHRVDLTTNKLTWKQIKPKGDCPLPCDKLAGWAHGDKLYFFGGFGERVPGSCDASWVRDEMSDRGWNNQFVCYNTKSNEWEWPRTYGPKPRPRAAHSAAVSGNVVYIFGGRLQSVRNDELHAIDHRLISLSGNLKSSMKGAHWPSGRSWHSFTFTSPTVAFIQGGMSNSNQTLDDVWKLTFQDDSIECEMQPTHITEGEEVSPIFWHQSVFFRKGNEIITVGGMKQLNGTDDPPNSTTIILPRTKHEKQLLLSAIWIRTNPLPVKRSPKSKPSLDRAVKLTSKRQKLENAKPDSDEVFVKSTSKCQESENAKSDDVCDHFGRLVAGKLRSLPNDQRIFAERLINDVLYEAQLGNLSGQSYLCIGATSMPE
ncbi:hypothetical protein LSTR_LSTR006917 [Laodelphax striatellus]|uniref:Uncharacterized protein n=1 Tax=Laodelphax striatellus TaxID=195883 RepID=A0A482X469_LAOST|nr:hypothetical protein LSTR_LSTR006917 [Laodelphax striatellus]